MSALTRYPPFNTQIYNSLLQSYVLFYKLYKVFFSQSKYIVYIEQSLVEKKKSASHLLTQCQATRFFFAEIFIQIPKSILFFKNQLNPNQLPVRPYATDLIVQITYTTIRFLFQTDHYVKILLELTS